MVANSCSEEVPTDSHPIDKMDKGASPCLNCNGHEHEKEEEIQEAHVETDYRSIQLSTTGKTKVRGCTCISQKVWYGAGHVYNDLCAAMWFSYTLLFFQVILNMEALAAGAMLLLGQVVDALATPLVGLLADKYSTKKMWHLIGTTLVTLTFPLIFVRCWGCQVNADAQYLQWWMPLYYSILITFFQIGWAAVQISHLAMIPAITDSLQMRNELTSIRYTASVCSSIAVYLITWSVMEATAYTKLNIGPDDDYKFRNVALIITGLGVLFAGLFQSGFSMRESRSSSDKTCKNVRNQEYVDEEKQEMTGKKLAKTHTIFYFLKKPFLYHASLLYVFSRLYWALTLVYVPMFLGERLAFNPKEGTMTVASVPLVLYISSFFSSLALKYRGGRCGNQLAYLLGSALSLASSLWIALFLSPYASTFQIYSVATLMGAGSSITVVSSLCITSDLIGPHSNQSATIYSIVTFADKLVTGIAVILIENHKCKRSEDCPQYYRGVLTYVCGGCALLGLVSLAVARITLRRRT